MISNNNRIFIIDDDPFWSNSLFKILNNLGYENVYKYSCGIEAVNHLHLNPSLVFLDYHMEDMNGLEVLTRIKEYFPEIGVIFCTAGEDLGVAMHALEKGSSDYLLKSNLEIEKIAMMIEEVFRHQLLNLELN